MKGMIASVLSGIVMVAVAQMSTAAPTPMFHCFKCKFVMMGGTTCRVCVSTHSPAFFNCSCDPILGCCVFPYSCTESGPGC